MLLLARLSPGITETENLLYLDRKSPVHYDYFPGGKSGLFEIQVHRLINRLIHLHHRTGTKLQETLNRYFRLANRDRNWNVQVQQNIDTPAGTGRVRSGGLRKLNRLRLLLGVSLRYVFLLILFVFHRFSCFCHIAASF